MPFEKPRILTDREANTIRGKCLVATATPVELMQLIGHFDLLVDKYESALRTLAGCLPPRIYVYGHQGEMWSDTSPESWGRDEFEKIDFRELLGDE